MECGILGQGFLDMRPLALLWIMERRGEERRLGGFFVGVCFLEVVGVVDGSIFVGGREEGALFVWESVEVVEWFPYCLFKIGVGQLVSQSVRCALYVFSIVSLRFLMDFLDLAHPHRLWRFFFVAPGLDYYSLYSTFFLYHIRSVGERRSYPKLKRRNRIPPSPFSSLTSSRKPFLLSMPPLRLFLLTSTSEKSAVGSSAVAAEGGADVGVSGG